MPVSTTVRGIRGLAATLVVSIWVSAGAQGAPAQGSAPDPIAAQIARQGTARVTVLLDLPFAPEGSLSAADAARQRQAIAAAQDVFLGEVVKGSASQVLNRFAWMPAVVLEIDAPTLERIRRSRRVKAVEADQLVQPMPTPVLPAAPQ